MKFTAFVKLIITNMVDNLSLLPMKRDEDNLATKNPRFISRTNKSLKGQLPSEKQTMVTKWIDWINRTQLAGYFLGVLASIMCTVSTVVVRWRIWQVQSEDGMYPGVIWVGIWRACYLHSTHPDNRYVHCEEFTERMSMLPKEIFLAQDLMTLSCILGVMAITLMSFALWNVVQVTTHKTFLLTLFNVGGLLYFLAGIIALIPISWNLHSILENRDIHFPESFKMPTIPKHQEAGAAVYVGFSAAVVFLVSGVMINCNKSVLQTHREKDASAPADDPLTAGQLSSNFAASVIMSRKEKETPEATAEVLTSLHYTDKDSSQTVQPQLLKSAKKVTLSVTPYQ